MKMRNLVKQDIFIVLRGNMMSSQTIYGRNGNNFFITHKAKRIKENYIKQVKRQYSGPVIDRNIKVDIKLFFGDRRKRDWDNFHKLTIDSLQGIVIKDDAQIMKAQVQKRLDKHNPRCEILIKKL